MALETVDRPATTVVGLNIRTQPMSPDIPALWPKFVARIAEIHGQTEPRVAYGVMRSEGTEALQYMAAVAVAAAEGIPAGMTSLGIPAGTYAVFRYPLSGLGAGFGEIFGRLLPSSDCVQIPGPLFERYDASFDPHDPQSMVEILIPVRRRAA